MDTIYLTILIGILSLKQGIFANGLSCYECRSVSASSQCISDVGESTICDKKYCTIYRQEYLDPPGKIQHFYRSCEDQPSYLDAVIQTASHKAYYRACTENHCNVGDGLVPLENTIVLKNSSSPSEIYVVPGIRSGGEKTVFLLDKLITCFIGLVLLLK